MTAGTGSGDRDGKTCDILAEGEKCGCTARWESVLGNLCDGHRDLALIAGIKLKPLAPQSHPQVVVPLAFLDEHGHLVIVGSEAFRKTSFVDADRAFPDSWTRLVADKPQPQVAPLTDFSTCLLNIEKSLSGLADIAESRSVTLGDKWGKLADGCIDSMESVQVLRNQANGIEMDEGEAV